MPAEATAPLALDGYTVLPPGKIAAIVTFLEMRARPVRPPAPDAGLAFERIRNADPVWYRALFRSIGAPWLWFSRLRLDDRALAGLLARDTTELHLVHRDGAEIGLVELDWTEPAEPQLAFLGLVPEAAGRGLGASLMDFAVARAFAAPIARFWVHTCTLDHPAALGSYLKGGFLPYAAAIEVVDDPRLTGLLPRDAAPRVPVLTAEGQRRIAG